MPRIVMAVLVRDDCVLLGHRHPERSWYPDVWDLPGGHVEDGEAPAAALRRELSEDDLTSLAVGQLDTLAMADDEIRRLCRTALDQGADAATDAASD